jgi:hypothetical protein
VPLLRFPANYQRCTAITEEANMSPPAAAPVQQASVTYESAVFRLKKVVYKNRIRQACSRVTRQLTLIAQLSTWWPLSSIQLVLQYKHLASTAVVLLYDTCALRASCKLHQALFCSTMTYIATFLMQAQGVPL